MDAAACQVPGEAKCMTRYAVVEGEPCCEGSSCVQWLGKQGQKGHYYCQYDECIPTGDRCDVSNILPY